MSDRMTSISDPAPTGIGRRTRADVKHLLCPLTSRWRRWRNGQPFWRDDKTAKMLGVADYGCPRCGYGYEKGKQQDTRPTALIPSIIPPDRRETSAP